ncbi:MAG TPA: amylo-alpha-1,6-glucosidase, partial [Planctomycetaceae bacterium]|nr:amylo-alpha-1,6-glucosidase [Planctomycetaceae bacterium]
MADAKTTPVLGDQPTNAQPKAKVSQPEAQAEGSVFRILASASLADERTRVLKHGDTFAVFDHYGDITHDGLGEEGIYHDGTRFLSGLLLELEGARPFFLSSTVRDENDQLAVALTNPDLLDGDQMRLPLGTLHLAVRRFLWNGVCYQQLRISNHGLEPVKTSLGLHFQADFADIFEVRGMKRKARGQDLPAEVSGDTVVLGYRGLDGVVRRTRLKFDPAPSRLTTSAARMDFELRPQQELTFAVSIACERDAVVRPALGIEEARLQAQSDLERFSAWSCHLRTSNSQINAWISRAVSDLHMLTTELTTGPYPYAGIPWFNTPFGRDGLITALECLWLRPGLARGVLSYLAATQATAVIPEEDAEPGKILHETRQGEMAAAKEMPFGRYYGSADATPLFVFLAGAYYERTADRPFLQSLWPHVEAALEWIDRYGDRDGDGLTEYSRQSASGLLHQGWKDSDDAIFHADGALAQGPIALCEVQGYVYAAWCAASAMAAVLGKAGLSERLTHKAEQLRQRFEQAFWCEELATYALALDGDKRPCRVRTSNSGQCLFTGIAGAEHARQVARTLLAAGSFSGWGVRTLATSEKRYNPMSYHNGSVWPHDNALIARGLARYGLGDKALRIWSGLFQGGLYFDLYRMPELFCGFPQDAGEGPVAYPVACAPQAWSAASVFLLFQAILGLEINGPEGQVRLTRPTLPNSLGELRIHNLQVAGGSVDLP